MRRGNAPDVACPGCLGERRCWVCLGTGRLRSRHGASTPCHVCSGTGVCASCRRYQPAEPAPVTNLIPASRASHETTRMPDPRLAAG